MSSTGSTQAPRSPRSSPPASPAPKRRPRSPASPAPGAVSTSRETGGFTVVDDYGHHPTEVARTLAAVRERYPGAAVRVLFQPHLYSRTRHLAGELAEALATADDVTVTDVYPAREQPIPGVTGKLVVDALSDRGVLAAWTPTVEEGVERVRRRMQAGDVLLIVGAGDIDRAVAVAAMSVDEHVSLARYTTIGTGGPARFFAKPETLADLQAVLRWAAEEGVPVETIGLGSNLLVHDDGVDALVLRLAGELATAHVEGQVLVAGGGATNAVCLHRARAAGLGGFEFASAIPGTAGGGVRMNAGAYGRDWNAVVVERGGRRRGRGSHGHPRGARLRLPALGTQTRRGRGAGAVQARAEHARGGEGARRRTARPAEGDPADEQAHVRERVQEPGRRAGGGSLIEACGLKGHRCGGALISPRHANFIENADDARPRTHRPDGRGEETRARDVRCRARHEVQFIGPLALPDL